MSNQILSAVLKINFVTGEDSSSASSWMDDDSNFETSTSESEDDSICNTMLLTGPHGVGKTSAIYALAAELGYQVCFVVFLFCFISYTRISNRAVGGENVAANFLMSYCSSY